MSTMNSQDTRSDHYFLRPIGFSTSKILKRPRPAPIKTSGIKPASIRNATVCIENSQSPAPENITLQDSALLSALNTPRAIITAIPWKLRSRTATATEPSTAFSFSATSPTFQDSAFRLSAEPMESSCLPSGRMMKSPFSPYPSSPPLSAYESRLTPNTYRDISRIDTNVQSSGSTTPGARSIRTPVSKARMMRNRSQPISSPTDPSPITPVAVELEYPIILDPMTPKNYTFGTAMTPSPLPSSKELPRPIPTRTRNDALKRARGASRQDLRSQAVASQPVPSAPCTLPVEELNFLLPSTVYDPRQTVTTPRAPETIETYLPNKRTRRQHNVSLDEYTRSYRLQH